MEQGRVLQDDKLRCEIHPELGGSIHSMQFYAKGRWVDLMRPTPADAVSEQRPGDFASFTMLPYSNRIENGILCYEGRQYRLPRNNKDGHNIHGVVRDKPWQVQRSEPQLLELAFDLAAYPEESWPFCFTSAVSFAVKHQTMTMSISLQNTGKQSMPAGMGIHPYFVRNPFGVEEVVRLTAPLKGVYPGATPIPTGPWQELPEKWDFRQGRRLTTEFLDKCFRTEPGPVVVEWQDSGLKLAIESDRIFGHLIVFCPPDNPGFFAIEPVTNANNGFNMAECGITDTGVLYLEPGQQISGSIAFTISMQEAE